MTNSDDAGQWTDTNHPDVEIVSLREAAQRLGISSEAIRKRIMRGTLRGHKRGRQWFVTLDPDGSGQRPDDATWTGRRQPSGRDRRTSGQDALVDELRGRVSFLERLVE